MSIIKVHYYQNHPLMSIKTLLSLCLYLYPIPVSSLSLLLVPFFSPYTAPSITSQLSPSNFRIQGMMLVFFNGPLQHHFEFYWCTPYV